MVTGASILGTLTAGDTILNSLTIGSLLSSNIVTTNQTVNNLLGINISSANFITTNETIANSRITNSLITNLTVGSMSTLNLLKVNSITTGNILINSSFTASSNIISIDSRFSITNPAILVFRNTSSVGDFKIYNDGGETQLQGGGGRSTQIGSFHEIILSGGRNVATPINFVNGNNSTFNTVIINTSNSIALRIIANSTQTMDLTQWVDKSGFIVSKIDSFGKLLLNNTSVSDSPSVGGSLITLGGVSIAKNLKIGATINSFNVSSGSLIASGGAGFNGDIYGKNIYSNDIILGIFGSEFQYVEDLSVTGSTNTDYTLKLSMTTGSLIGGTYNIGVKYRLAPNSTTNKDSQISCIVDPINLSSGNLISDTITRPASILSTVPIYENVILPLTSGIHIITIIWKPTGSVSNIDNCAISLYRLI